jgi:DNA-binding HxlR family transcriptional regulator
MKLEKVTEAGSAAAKRRYDDACGTAHGLELIGERWALLVLRELMLGPKRFGDLKADLPGISANVLTQRLEGLEASGLLVRKRLPPPASVQVYELTQWGYEAEPIVQELGRWAARSPLHDPTLPISGTSLMLSFRTMFDPARADGFAAAIGLRIGAESFVARVENGRLDARRGDPAGADALFTGSGAMIAAAVYGDQPFELLAPALTVTGDREAARRFTSFFVLPPKASAPPA